jgi:hypothetical protein
MRRVLMLFVVMLALCAPGYVFAGGCDSAGEFYITFTFKGVEYTCELGLNGINGYAFAAVQPGGYTYFAGTNVEKSIDEIPAGDFVYVEGMVYAAEVGSYDYMDFSVYIEISFEGNYLEYMSYSGTLNITAFGEVGEAVEGDFDIGVAENIAEGLVTPLNVFIPVEGTFRVQRIEYTVPAVTGY